MDSENFGVQNLGHSLNRVPMCFVILVYILNVIVRLDLYTYFEDPEKYR